MTDAEWKIWENATRMGARRALNTVLPYVQPGAVDRIVDDLKAELQAFEKKVEQRAAELAHEDSTSGG